MHVVQREKLREAEETFFCTHVLASFFVFSLYIQCNAEREKNLGYITTCSCFVLFLTRSISESRKEIPDLYTRKAEMKKAVAVEALSALQSKRSNFTERILAEKAQSRFFFA